MQVQVSLTIELAASASLTEMEQQIQAAGQQAMRAALKQAAMMAGCSWPYDVARSQLKRLSGADISAEEIRLLTNRQGQQRAGQQQAEAEHPCSSPVAQAPTAEQGPPPMP